MEGRFPFCIPLIPTLTENSPNIKNLTVSQRGRIKSHRSVSQVTDPETRILVTLRLVWVSAVGTSNGLVVRVGQNVAVTSSWMSCKKEKEGSSKYEIKRRASFQLESRLTCDVDSSQIQPLLTVSVVLWVRWDYI